MLLIDNSAWSRLLSGAVPQVRANVVVEMLDADEVATCLPFLLEAGYSARSAADHEQSMDRLGTLPSVSIDSEIEATARKAQRELAAVGHHRLSPIDLMIAACAHEAEYGVLHYDRDYDVIAEHTSLNFESLWVAPSGTL
ncbi:MAG: PIN domain-containing protein [Actinobacteria bacterium]|nr:PIN domain-containing protein [Actinomycetota bacterium]MBS1887364.1 PIN domain-containing protein [Actinomycetota bacterium]